MYTYAVWMNLTLSVDEQIVTRARKRASALGKSLNQVIRDYLEKLAGADDPERSIKEFEDLSARDLLFDHSRFFVLNADILTGGPLVLGQDLFQGTLNAESCDDVQVALLCGKPLW